MIELKLLDREDTAVTGRGVLGIGRAWMNDLVLWDAPQVSGRHGQVEERDGALFYRDVGSRNGSRVLRADGSEVVCEPGGEAVCIDPADQLLLGSGDNPVHVRASLVDESQAESLKLLTTMIADRPLVELAALESGAGRSFNQFLVGLLGELTPEHALDLLAATILETFRQVGEVQVFTDGAEPVIVRRRDTRGTPAPVYPELLERVRGGGEAILFEDSDEGVAGYGAPIPGTQGVIGVLVAHTAGASEAEMRLLQTYAHYAGRVLEDAQRRGEDARRITQLNQENQDLRQRLRKLDPSIEILGDDPLLGEALEQAERVAPYPTPVLITGPTGSGKELIARAVHRLSDRSKGPFLAINCGALAENLLESELFGHEKGAFTGADRAKVGLFGAADGGTLFLDEIGEITPTLQVRLLRVLQEGEFFRVGGTRPVRVDVRVLAATHRDLETEVAEGRFREDLYYRLAVFPVQLPPLRDRPRDVAILASHFAERFARRFGKGPVRISQVALDKLSCEEWPGNVRELQNRVERAVILCDGPEIGPTHVAAPGSEDRGDEGFLPLKDAVRRFKGEHVNRALRHADGVQREAAQLLQVDPGNLSRLLRELGLR